MARKKAPTPLEVFYAAENKRRAEHEAYEKAHYNRRVVVAEAAREGLGSRGHADPSGRWFVFYKTNGPWTLAQTSPGDGWVQGVEVKVGWLSLDQLVSKLKDIVGPLPVTNDAP